MLKTFIEPLTEYKEVEDIRADLKKGKTPIQVTGCIDVQKCHLIQTVGNDYKYRVVVTYNDLHGRELCDQYRIFDNNVLFYPAKDFIFYQADLQGNQLVKERMRVIEKLMKGEPCTVVLSIDAGMDKRQPIEALIDATICIKPGDEIEVGNFTRNLMKLGYAKQAKVEEPGDYCVHGGIIDVYPLLAQAPYRIELWGDEIDTIRIFDAASQRSIEQVEEAIIGPMTESIFSSEEILAGVDKIQKEADKLSEKYRKEFKTEEAARIRKTITELKDNIEFMYYAVSLDSHITSFLDETVSLFDYFPKNETVFFVEEPARVVERGESVELEYRESMIHRLEKGYILSSQIDSVISCKEAVNRVNSGKVVTVSTMGSHSRFAPAVKYNLNVKSSVSYQADFKGLVNDINKYKKNKYRILLVSSSKTRAKRLAGDLFDYDIPAFFSDNEDRVVGHGEVMVINGPLAKGFEYPLIKMVVIGEADMFGSTVNKKKKAAKKPDGKNMLDFNQLNVGDYVIHENHGLGIYKGIYKVEVDNVIKDYIKLEYSGGMLYVPVTSLSLMQKYAGGGDTSKKYKINKLNSQEWKSTKSKVKISVNKIAEELVELYAKRQSIKGFSFSKDSVWQSEFEELFPYEETNDQLKAIEDTKADMESEKIMDRLICGDVGYGKTEIAIRAAFKAVQDSKQVAVLVPTTILAQQHYNTFVQRLKDFPVVVEELSRFRTKAEQKRTLERLRRGEVDIVIGTHRILSKDVTFKNLGLLVVDEEQRFGVTHKEKIKQMKASIDVLTLTATPIPRTMHMSLIGIRDMSVLEEPPVDRLPIQTYCMEHNDEMIREAIVREMARDGQVYYVVSRIAGIEDVAAKIREMVPEAVVAHAHGQMNEVQLEKIMMAFINGEIDVLVSTTIIETGMDISNVNTMIIDDADRFGLSQLYQLRGRVGRSNRTAYAFLMFSKDRVLKEEAEKRLSAIREFTDLGAGYKIAMRDLEIRGAGNLLGERQSGHMSAVGYDLYCKMLNEAVMKLKGEEVEEAEYETSIDVEISAYIPSTYIKNEIIKLDTYKRIAGLSTQDDISEMQDELIDRFGELPEVVDNLLYISYLRSFAHEVYVEEFKQKGKKLSLTMYPKAKIDVSKIAEYIASKKGKCKLESGKKPVFTYVLPESFRNSKEMMEEFKKILEEIQGLMISKEVVVIAEKK